jgi:hypothetical protein
VKVNTHPHLVPTLRKNGDIPLLAILFDDAVITEKQDNFRSHKWNVFSKSLFRTVNGESSVCEEGKGLLEEKVAAVLYNYHYN